MQGKTVKIVKPMLLPLKRR